MSELLCLVRIARQVYGNGVRSLEVILESLGGGRNGKMQEGSSRNELKNCSLRCCKWS